MESLRRSKRIASKITSNSKVKRLCGPANPNRYNGKENNNFQTGDNSILAQAKPKTPANGKSCGRKSEISLTSMISSNSTSSHFGTKNHKRQTYHCLIDSQ